MVMAIIQQLESGIFGNRNEDEMIPAGTMLFWHLVRSRIL
jgi:hypothetical protein